MTVTPSTMLALGTQAPDFTLPDTGGKMVSRDDFADAPALLVIFMCNHCPYVKHIREGLAKMGRDYQAKDVAVVGINSNDVIGFPQDCPEKMAQEVCSAGYTFPYLYDESQQVATAYRAACTPDFFLFDQGPQAGISRPDGRFPPRQWYTGNRRRPSGRNGRGIAGRAHPRKAKAEHGLQHQVETRKRT